MNQNRKWSSPAPLTAAVLLAVFGYGEKAEGQSPPAIPAAAVPAQPAGKVRAALAGDEPVWAGQKATLRVDLLVPGYFTDAAVFDLPRIPGLLLLPPAGSPAVGTEDIDGVSYTVQQHEVSIISLQPGPVTVPSFEIRFNFKRAPLDKDSVSGSVKTPAVQFAVKSVPGLPPGTPALTSADLTVTESWNPDPPQPGTQVSAGSAFVRTLSWTASDLPGMALPPLKPGKITGLGIYPATPEVNDTYARGELHASRQDSVTYLCRTGGKFTIPALTVKWWDPKAGELKETTFPARTLDVAAPPVPPIPLTRRALDWIHQHQLSLALTGILAIAALAAHRFARGPILAFCRQFRPRHLAPLNPRASRLSPRKN